MGTMTAQLFIIKGLSEWYYKKFIIKELNNSGLPIRIDKLFIEI